MGYQFFRFTDTEDPVKCCFHCPMLKLCERPRFSLDCYENSVEMVRSTGGGYY